MPTLQIRTEFSHPTGGECRTPQRESEENLECLDAKTAKMSLGGFHGLRRAMATAESASGPVRTQTTRWGKVLVESAVAVVSAPRATVRGGSVKTIKAKKTDKGDGCVT